MKKEEIVFYKLDWENDWDYIHYYIDGSKIRPWENNRSIFVRWPNGKITKETMFWCPYEGHLMWHYGSKPMISKNINGKEVYIPAIDYYKPENSLEVSKKAMLSEFLVDEESEK